MKYINEFPHEKCDCCGKYFKAWNIHKNRYDESIYTCGKCRFKAKKEFVNHNKISQLINKDNDDENY
jgi:predicted SprT family Zn-dependent metalloprotease